MEQRRESCDSTYMIFYCVNISTVDVHVCENVFMTPYDQNLSYIHCSTMHVLDDLNLNQVDEINLNQKPPNAQFSQPKCIQQRIWIRLFEFFWRRLLRFPRLGIFGRGFRRILFFILLALLLSSSILGSLFER
jgi:hypothetical protein